MFQLDSGTAALSAPFMDHTTGRYPMHQRTIPQQYHMSSLCAIGTGSEPQSRDVQRVVRSLSGLENGR
jgi:hypothetical protein